MTSVEIQKKPDIYRYTNYRDYLKDFYNYKKNISSYSFALFSNRAGLKSPNYLKLVMDGERSITHKNILGFINALGLSESEASFFEYLVKYNDSVKMEEKKHFFTLLSDMALKKTKGKVQILLERDHYDVLNNWYTLAVLQLSFLKDFSDDSAWVSNALCRKITVKEAKEALAVLEKNGLLHRDENGKLVNSGKTLKYEDGIVNLAVRQYHKAVIDKVKSSIEELPIDRRHLKTLAIAIDENDYQSIVSDISEFVTKLNDKYGIKDENVNGVCQISMQSLMLTPKRINKKGEEKVWN